MKVLYVFRSLAIWGGIERILIDKMNYLVTEYGYNVYMLTADQGNHPIPYQLVSDVHIEDLKIRFHDQYKYKGIRRLYDRYKRYELFKRKLRDKISQFSPNIIICVADGYHTSIIKVKGKIPLLVEAHNNCSMFFEGGNILKNLLLRYQRHTFSKVQGLVALTEGDAKEWGRLFNDVRVIPNFVQLNLTGHYSTNDNKRVLFVGRLEAQKCIFDAVEIWKSIYPSFSDWRLDIYGEGEEYQQLYQLISELNMNIFIHQPTDKIFDRYRESDILILTSKYEPFGLVIPEAMSCGLPVVSYRSPYGPESILTDGYDGFLIPLFEKTTFSERLSLLMGDIQLRRQMGKNAVVSSLRFSADKIMPKWKSLIEELTS